MSTLRLPHPGESAPREYGSPPTASGPDRPACTVRSRTAATPDRPDGARSTRIEGRAAPCATLLFYLMASGNEGRRGTGAPRWSAGLARMMPDVLRQDHENDVFGDIRGVVADALQVPGNENEIERRLN